MQRCNRRSLKDTESPKLGSGSCGHTSIPNAIVTAVNPQKRRVCPNDSSGNQPQRESADDCSILRIFVGLNALAENRGIMRVLSHPPMGKLTLEKFHNSVSSTEFRWSATLMSAGSRATPERVNKLQEDRFHEHRIVATSICARRRRKRRRDLTRRARIR